MELMRKKLLPLMLSVVTAAAVMMPALAKPTEVYAAAPSIQYNAHCQTYGWRGYVKDGATAGTTGASKRMEAVQVKLSGASGGVQYQVHCQTYGWGGYMNKGANKNVWVQNGATAGTTGEAKRMEAIKIKLTGAVASQYDVYYRGHSQRVGWTRWAKNGEACGTEGLGLRMEAIQVKLIKKGSSAPVQSGAQAYYTTGNLSKVARRNIILGDSRAAVMSKAITGKVEGTRYNLDKVDTGWVGNNRFICQWGGSLWWNAQNNPGGWVGQRIKQVLSSENLTNTNIIVTIGANEMCTSASGYTASHDTFFRYLNSLSKSGRLLGVQVYWCPVGPCQHSNHMSIRNGFNSRVNYTGATKIDPWGSVSIGYIDGDHYNADTCKRWFNYLNSASARTSYYTGSTFVVAK